MGMQVRLLKISAAIVVLLAIAAWAAWPVQILVMANRLTHPVASNRPVHWAQGPATPAAGEPPPNIVLIVADDLGINDLTAEGHGTGVAGGLVPTPNIDAIGHEGADFTVAYAGNATCSPSRAALHDRALSAALRLRIHGRSRRSWQVRAALFGPRAGRIRRSTTPSFKAGFRRWLKWAFRETR